MPELPEVEVVRRDLDREVVGKKIKAVDVDGMRSVRRHHNRKQRHCGPQGKSRGRHKGRLYRTSGTHLG